ncbi:tetratricopeptide repeat protein [Nocardia puris]|uniref:tetratricopeptide repeat protein n=1 Tax=Nocardia puris TaxID=208602 RepID=UPI0018945DD2|nr:tetratricopeptide repeat protein [Nocardia puris]MBF6214421.1 tetratricopeptide repeat protein [Nocardia puris]MBF6369036.1 tetratricopeptide repeat protein [Nocardia puris]MBF6462816.1 tetratricopeptide repeat protein [Nocardia puris]
MTFDPLGAHDRENGRDPAVTAAERAVARQRSLAADPDALAEALTSLGAALGQAGRTDGAITAVEEARGLYRHLAGDDPDHLPDLLATLGTLADLYDLGERFDDTVTAYEEMVDIYRHLSPTDRSCVTGLAQALHALELALAQVGRRDEAEDAWQRAIAHLDTEPSQFLRLARARGKHPGSRRALEWLAQLQSEVTDRGLLAILHHAVRWHRRNDPLTWDAWWAERTGTQPAPWMTVDARLVETAMRWVECETFDQERDVLLDHPELLRPHADVAVAEAFLIVDEFHAARLAATRDHAKDHGVEDAYEPLLRLGAWRDFLSAPAATQRETLRGDLGDLAEEGTLAAIMEQVRADPADVRLRRAAGLVALAVEERDQDLLDEVFAAVENPTRFPPLLDATIRDLHRAPALQLLVEVALTTARDHDALAVIGFYDACSAAIDENPNAATSLRQALALSPHRRPEWAKALTELAELHPALETLIPVVTEDVSPGAN